MISCPGLHPGDDVAPCEVSPQVTGETPEEAWARWNRRELPLTLVFAADYLDGVMEHENPEIAKQWSKVRDHLGIAS